MSNIDKQALIAKIKKQTESFDTVVLKEDEANALLDELEAKDKRIAELEAREVKLPKPTSVLHRRDFMDAHRSIYAYPEAEVNAALADAGINVAAAGKGE
ncbi:hypothetical protein [Enterobacter hormaechei]|uniref:hypothetical protein n=1 Tax=Enterobacter hormaechei TaxID=158836 RepID=UPI0020933B7F|nr:hypothetical protein [Enterobacter hormaechei]